MWWAKALHCFSEEFQRGLAIPALGDIAFQYFSFVVNGPPEVVRFTVDFYENFIQMTLPIRMSTKLLNPFSSDLRGEQRPKAIPPKPDRFVADVDPALMQKIFHITQRKRISNVQHYRQANDLWRRFKIAKWTAFCHPEKLGEPPAHFNQVLSDNARSGLDRQVRVC